MKVAVIGLGYVGLPLSLRLCMSGHEVFGIDKNNEKITAFKRRKLPFAQNEPNLAELFLECIKSRRLIFSASYNNLKNAKVIFIAVDTPILRNKPDNRALISAITGLSEFLQKDSIIVIESTVAPNTCNFLIIPEIEKRTKLKINKDFFLAVVPERIRPNYIFKQLTTLPRVIGISSPKIRDTLNNLYSKITSGELDFVDLTTAEVVKTVENSYRDVQIAFANEIALACEELGVNVWGVRKLINKDPLHDMHKPGAGVGGHCLPKDPWLLASSVNNKKLNLIKNARKINDSMPAHIFDLTKEAIVTNKLQIDKVKLVILGYAYTENTDDSRNSPTESLTKILKRQKIQFRVHDPYIKPFNNQKVEMTITGTDCLILMVGHKQYQKLDLNKIGKLMRNKIIIDGRNFFSRNEVKAAGFVYKGIGNV